MGQDSALTETRDPSLLVIPPQRRHTPPRGQSVGIHSCHPFSVKPPKSGPGSGSGAGRAGLPQAGVSGGLAHPADAALGCRKPHLCLLQPFRARGLAGQPPRPAAGVCSAGTLHPKAVRCAGAASCGGTETDRGRDRENGMQGRDCIAQRSLHQTGRPGGAANRMAEGCTAVSGRTPGPRGPCQHAGHAGTGPPLPAGLHGGSR